ncbi:MAG: haloacid dehalogenase [Bacteroidetes bacterium 24-39-8]|jgi:Ca2+-transporting ATPase|nr:MAG: haloacid dehalogenase [Bacteroidetes bacterium 24-39-8]HQS56602.1 cation-translocating P-type ATPase [Sediminibacterium sp.]
MQDSNPITGLTQAQVAASRTAHGSNTLAFKKENGFWEALKTLAKEPMVVLLLAASVLYFISGKTGDGIFLGCAIVLVAAISLYQDSRSRNALEKLKNFTEPRAKVIRDGETLEINTDELVIDDCMVIEEGSSIPADGCIIQSNDFSVNESILTGESFAVFKDVRKEDCLVFGGTQVASGLAIARISAIGNETKLGKIGKSLESIQEEKTPLEKQIANFVQKMVLAGAIIFGIVWFINYSHSKDVLDSLLKALTLAMSILPEEIPVAFTSFMALGAWRLMKMGIIVKQMKTVETLGSATVICTDKTGTITQNKMSLAGLYCLQETQTYVSDQAIGDNGKDLVRTAMWASEPIPFDPMEIALHQRYLELYPSDERPNYHMKHEYPLGGKPPMMTHVFENKTGERIIAAKGAPEAIMAVSNLDKDQIGKIEAAISSFTKEGYRVLAIAKSNWSEENFPDTQQAIPFQFMGLVAFFDPPKDNISETLAHFYKAGINVKIVTGDNAATTLSIAKQIGFKGTEQEMSGAQLMELSDAVLEKQVMDTQVFTRMFPEAKLRIINALKATGQIVAMTGDGVNDGPALKAAHIGIAMGKKGTEIAKQAASLILVEDDLAKMVDAIAMGRRIYTNLKKAIQYIISIHIPIVLTVFLPLALGWVYPNIFSPVHIIFLELIMGPTCSIIYENEPMEQHAMSEMPREMSNTFFNWKELTTSIIQGLMITAGCMFTYLWAVKNGLDEPSTRTMVFLTLISANIFLTLVNRSFYYSILTTLGFKNNLVLWIIGITIAITIALIYIPVLSQFFEFQVLNSNMTLIAGLIGFVSVIWFELVKWYQRLNSQNHE